MSGSNLEQRINIKFCAKIGKSDCETGAILKMAYGVQAMKKLYLSGTDGSRIDKTFQMRQDVDIYKLQRIDASVNRVQTLMRSNRWLNVQLIVGVTFYKQTVWHTLT